MADCSSAGSRFEGYRFGFGVWVVRIGVWLIAAIAFTDDISIGAFEGVIRNIV